MRQAYDYWQDQPGSYHAVETTISPEALGQGTFLATISPTKPSQGTPKLGNPLSATRGPSSPYRSGLRRTIKLTKTARLEAHQSLPALRTLALLAGRSQPSQPGSDLVAFPKRREIRRAKRLAQAPCQACPRQPHAARKHSAPAGHCQTPSLPTYIARAPYNVVSSGFFVVFCASFSPPCNSAQEGGRLPKFYREGAREPHSPHTKLYQNRRNFIFSSGGPPFQGPAKRVSPRQATLSRAHGGCGRGCRISVTGNDRNVK